MKDYKFQIVLYEESEKDIIENLKNNYLCAYICHDKDVDKDGNLIKPHWHFVVKLDKEMRFSTIAKKINVRIEKIEKVNSLNEALKYLIHKNAKNKYQYDVSLVGGGLKENLLNLILDQKTQKENENVLAILKIIEENKNAKFSYIVKLVCQNNLYADFRRGASIFRQVYYEALDLRVVNCYTDFKKGEEANV